MDDRRFASSCYLPSGEPKLAFASKGEAVDKILEQHNPQAFCAYECALHGFHIGGRTPRRERAAYDSRTYQQALKEILE